MRDLARLVQQRIDVANQKGDGHHEPVRDRATVAVLPGPEGTAEAKPCPRGSRWKIVVRP